MELAGTTFAGDVGVVPTGYVYRSAFDAWYQYVAGSTATIDGYTVLSAPNGRYLLRSDRISLAPDANGGDDWANLAAAWTACAYKAKIVLRAGTWHCSTTQQMVSGTFIEAEPGVSVVCALPTVGGSGSPDHAPFYAQPASHTILTTLHTTLAEGARSFVVADTTGFTVGMEIALILSNVVRCRTITAISGTLLGTITVDELIWEAFPATTTQVVDRTAPRDITVRGNGMKVTGTFDAVVEISSGADCYVSGIRGTASVAGPVGFNFDVGARRCVFERIAFDGANLVTNGLHMESAEHCSARDCLVKRPVQYGYMFTTGLGVTATACHVTHGSGAAAGFLVQPGQSSLPGDSTTLLGCTATDMAGQGFVLLNGSRRVRLGGCEARHCGGTGLAINSGSSSSSDIHVSDFVADYCQYGVYVIAGSVGCTFQGIQAHHCTQYGLACEGAADVSGIVSRECTLGGVYALSAALLRLRGFDLSKTFNGNWNGIRMESTSSVEADGGRLSISGTGTGIHFSDVSSGALRMSRISTIGGTFGVVANAGPVWRGQFVDMSGPGSGLSTQYSISGSGSKNFGTVAMSSGSASFAFASIKAQDRVFVRRTASGGTPGHYTATVSAGTGVSIASSSGTDSSTVAVEIG